VAGASTGTIADKRDIKNFINYKEIETPTKFKSYTQAFTEWEERKALDESEGTLTVATFNVLNENDYRKVGVVAAVIAARQKNIILQTKAQVIGLNEVTKTNFFTPLTYHSPTGPIKYVDRIYTDYNMVELGNPEPGFLTGECFLSAYSITGKTTHKYADEHSDSICGYSHGIVTVNNKQVSIYVTHFDYLGTYITNQINELLQAVSSDTVPHKIIMGDFNFNVETDTARIALFTNAGFRGVNAGKYKTYLDNSPIDEIMITSNIDIIESGCIHVTDANGYVVGTQAGGYKAISDHSPVYARLRFN
jgi:endonuclease/exonuclease/phosphatase family metal-dependent hydrolase